MSDYELAPEGEAFDEQWVPPELPADDAGDEAWDAYLAQFDEEPEPEQQVDPLEYPQLAYPQGDPPGVFEQQLGNDLRRESWAEQFHADLAGEVRELAASSEFGIRDEQAIERVTSGVLAAREYVFKSWLGNGASVGQAIEALNDLDLGAAVRLGLEQEKYRAVTDHGSLGDWRRGREEQARKDMLAGKAPQPSVYDSPTWQKMARASAAYVERVEARKQAEREAMRRGAGRGR